MSSYSPVPIIMLHRIGLPCLRKGQQGLTWSSLLFQWSMLAASRRGFAGLSLSALLDVWEERADCSGRHLVLTFDDAYSSLHRAALPVLRRLGWTATVFACSGLLGRRNEWMARPGVQLFRLMDDAELRRVRQAGFEVGAHTRTHADLARLPAQEAKAEIAQSRVELQSLTGDSVRTFAYPFGSYKKRDVEFVREAGFSAAVTVRPGFATPQDDRYQLPRLSFHSSVFPPKRFLALIESGQG